MYPNLEAEIARNKISKYNIAKEIGKTYGTLVQKLNRKYPLTWDEASIIQEKFFPNSDIKFLFATDDDRKTA